SDRTTSVQEDKEPKVKNPSAGGLCIDVLLAVVVKPFSNLFREGSKVHFAPRGSSTCSMNSYSCVRSSVVPASGTSPRRQPVTPSARGPLSRPGRRCAQQVRSAN